jgi:hypothetical protein
MKSTKEEIKLNKTRREIVAVSVLSCWLIYSFSIQAVNIYEEEFFASSFFSQFSTESFLISMQESSQTITVLSPIFDPEFNFTTGEWLEERKGDGYYQLGDITFRTKFEGEKEWESYSTAAMRLPVEPLKDLKENVLAAADLGNTLPEDVPLEVKRYWEKSDDKLVLRFELKNKSDKNVEIGALGIP